jgi:hypothetical protein
MERAMPNKRTELMALTIFALAACGVLANAVGATAPAVRRQSTDVRPHNSARIPAFAGVSGMNEPPLVVAQNPFSSFSLQQMPEPPVSPIIALAACGVLANAVGATAPAVRHRAGPMALQAQAAPPPLVVAQNPFSSFSLQQMPEPPVSPINPGTLPGTTAAIGGSATGTNPITGLPCDGTGSISVSGAGGLPGTTATPPPGTNETLDQIPVGTPVFSSIYGSQTNLGAC